jgi:hypothetical protein
MELRVVGCGHRLNDQANRDEITIALGRQFQLNNGVPAPVTSQSKLFSAQNK